MILAAAGAGLAGLVEGGEDPAVGEQAVDDVGDGGLVGWGQAAGEGDLLGELVAGGAEDLGEADEDVTAERSAA